jgi:DUF971 family protein
VNVPSQIKLNKGSRSLELSWPDGRHVELSCELLRVYSPSAEVKGHGPGQEVLQVGKKNVTITELKAVGNYALQLVFDDGHDTGIYSYDYLLELGEQREQYWNAYLERMHAAGASRDPDAQVVRIGL